MMSPLPSLWIFFFWSTLLAVSSSAFVIPSSTGSFLTGTTSRSSTTLQAALLPWEDIAYNAQSTAGSLATGALQGNPSNLLQSVPILYAAGLLTSCSPCVWGLLPVTVSYISTAAGERADGQTTLPTLAFAAGLALVFCSFGVAAAQLGTVFGNTNTNVWLTLLSAAICCAMGLQLLELVNLPLLSSSSVKKSFRVNNNNNKKNEDDPVLLDATGNILKPESEKDSSGSLVRTFVLGGSSALVASPCATPVLTSILAYVASAQNAALGAFLLLAYTLGYATPLLWIAATGGQALVDLKQSKQQPDSIYAKLGPWVTPLTGGVLLGYGTNGILTALLGDPTLAALAPVFE